MEALLDKADEEDILVRAISHFVEEMGIKDIILLRKCVQGVFAISSRHPKWENVQDYGINNAKISTILMSLSKWKKNEYGDYEQYEGVKTMEVAGRVFLPVVRSYGYSQGEEHLVMLVLYTRKEKKPPKKQRIDAGLYMASLLKVYALKRHNETLKNLVGACAGEIKEAYEEMIPFKIENEEILDADESKVGEIIPIAFGAYLDEAIGPLGLVGSPNDFELFMISRAIVGSFAIVDFDLVNISDFILNTSHQVIKIHGKSFKGTLMSLFFSRKMPQARGGYELHSLNIFVNDTYQNQMVSFAPAFKAHLYQFGDKYKHILQKYDNMIPELDNEELNSLKKKLLALISDLRLDLTAHLINPPDKSIL